MSYEQVIIDAVRMPPRDESCEQKEGQGFNVGYERGYLQAKADCRAIARRADAETSKLIAKIDILEKLRDGYNELLAEVCNKVDGLSRHDRAKAIIISSEQMRNRGLTGDYSHGLPTDGEANAD